MKGSLLSLTNVFTISYTILKILFFDYYGSTVPIKQYFFLRDESNYNMKVITLRFKFVQSVQLLITIPFTLTILSALPQRQGKYCNNLSTRLMSNSVD